jgi:glycosyltransferase involved in cell wall biosynthesis
MMSDNTTEKKKILFVYTGLSSFVKNDLDILASAHSVELYHFKPVKGIARNALEMIRQFIYLLFWGWKYDYLYCWFADYHSFLPVIFAKLSGKKAFVVIGGYDVCRIRKLNYGAFCSPFRGWFCAASMRKACLILPVSGYVARKAKVVAPLAKQKMIYNCVTPESHETTIYPRTNTVLTVGLIENERTFYLKGIDTFIETARLLPDFRFEIVGINRPKLAHMLENLPANVTLFNKVLPEELASFYRKAKIYCQLSRSESFGVSIAEAMSFGGYPVVTNEGGMPEVVGNAGSVVRRDPQLIADLINELLLKIGFPDEAAVKMQVVRHFTKEQRAKDLLILLNGQEVKF